LAGRNNLFAGRDLQNLAHGWVASRASFALPHFQCAKAANTDTVALLQVPRDTFNHSGEQILRQLLGQFVPFRKLLEDAL
jgi:hypothetical protein